MWPLRSACGVFLPAGRFSEEGWPREALLGNNFLANNVQSFLPILIYFVAVLGFAGFSLIAPHLVAPRKSTLVKDMPYESGMDPVGTARKPLAIKFYLLAIVFLLFDVELLFIYPWAVALNAEGGLSQEARLPILVVMMTLLATLAIAYFYAWRKGVFQWRHR